MLLTGQPSNPNTPRLYSPEDHGAVLPVKGKVVDGDGTSTAVDGRRQPVHTAVRRHQGIAVKCYLELSIHTVHRLKQRETHIFTILFELTHRHIVSILYLLYVYTKPMTTLKLHLVNVFGKNTLMLHKSYYYKEQCCSSYLRDPAVCLLLPK